MELERVAVCSVLQCAVLPVGPGVLTRARRVVAVGMRLCIARVLGAVLGPVGAGFSIGLWAEE